MRSLIICVWIFSIHLVLVYCQLISTKLFAIIHLRRDRGYSKTLGGTVTSTVLKRNPKYKYLRQIFYPQSKVIILNQNDNTNVILNMFCQDILENTLPLILHINNPYYHLKSRAQKKYVDILASYLGVPILSWDTDVTLTSMDESKRILKLSPSLYQQTAAIFSILDNYNWTDISLVTTKYTGHQHFTTAVHEQVRKSKSPKTDKYKYEIISELHVTNTTKEALRESLSSLKLTDTRIILCHAKSTETSQILEVASELGLTGTEYMWILTLQSIPKNRGMRAGKGYPLGLLGIFYENGYDKDAMDSVLKQAVSIWASALNNMARDIRYGNLTLQVLQKTCNSSTDMFWNGGKDLFSYLKNINIFNYNNNISFADDGLLKESAFSVLNLQKHETGTYNNWVKVGAWSSLQGLQMKEITWMGESGGPPLGRPARRFLKIATLKEEPYVMYSVVNGSDCGIHSVKCRIYRRHSNKERLDNHTIPACCTGLSIDLLIQLSQQLNFDFDLFEVEDGEWGAANNDNEWNGLVQVLKDNKADMVVTAFKISPDRNSQVEFSVPYLETGITIIVSIREGAISPKAFLEPYDYPSWGLILVFSVHATAISIFIFEWLSPDGLDRGRVSSRDHKFSLYRSVWLIWAMLLSAAVSTDTPRSVSSRFLANLWALFALVFLASYTANLAAFMITKEEFYDLSGIRDWRLQNPQSLKPPFKFGTIPNGITDSNIKKNDINMWKYMRKYKQLSVPAAIMAVKSQKIHAFIYDATVLEYEAGRDKQCRLRTVGNWYAMTGYGVGFPKFSTWINKVNRVLLQLEADGEMERLKKFWLKGACRTRQKSGVSKSGMGKAIRSPKLGILNFTSAFILLACGIAVGTSLHLLEHIYYQFRGKKIQVKKQNTCSCVSLLNCGQNTVGDTKQYLTRYKCQNRLCDVEYWKIQHKLDMALLKITRLQTVILGITSEKERNDVWKYEPKLKLSLNRETHTGATVDGNRSMVICQIERESSF